MANIGAFCEIYGNTIRNRVIEFLMENHRLDFAVGDMAKELSISRPKAYEIINNFEEKKYVKKSRIIGKTQLYILNKQNNIVRLLLKNFKNCLRVVLNEHSEKTNFKTAKNKKAIAV